MIGNTDTVTVVNKTSNGYVTHVVDKVFWYMGNSMSVNGKGVGISSEPSCIFPYESLSKYTDGEATTSKFTLKRGDYIIRGRVSRIESVKDVNQYENVMTIKSVIDHRKGSTRVQHITVR